MNTPTTAPTEDDEREVFRQLALRSQQGEKDAYEELLHLVYQRVQRFLLPRISSEDVREDILQDILLSVHVSLKSYSGKDSFTAWLFTIARRRLIDFLRKKHRRTVEEITDGPWFEMQPAEEQMASFENFVAEMKKLPDSKRRAVELVHLEGRSTSEAAEELGISENNLRVTLHRAVKEIKVQLKESA